MQDCMSKDLDGIFFQVFKNPNVSIFVYLRVFT